MDLRHQLPDRHARHGRSEFFRLGRVHLRPQRQGCAGPRHQPSDRTDLVDPVRTHRPQAGNRSWKDTPVYFGGPVQTERGSCCTFHRAPTVRPFRSRRDLADDVQGRARSRRHRQWSAEDAGDARLFRLGRGPARGRDRSHAWLTAPANAQILFDMPAEQRYDAALRLLGVDPTQLSGQVGHA